MTIQALIFLHQLKMVQQSESGTIWIDDENKVMKTVIEDGVCKEQDVVIKDLKNKWTSIYSMTDYLQNKGLLTRQRMEYYFLTHQGYHYFQTILSQFLRFLLTSIAVPIIVAFLTTLITLWIQALFN